MGGKRILVVDDEAAICTVLEDLLGGPDADIVVVRDGKTALATAADRFDVAILDLSLPGASGLDILHEIKRHHPDTPVIIMTAYASIQTAIKALRQGAYDFITKPFDLDELQLLVERALERTRLIDENRYLLDELKSRYNFDNVIGHSREVQEAYLMAARVADSNASVLVLGETGTGKEFLARAIHYQSSRAEGPFIKVNCAALPEGLLESELFGHEKGAFTNAVARRIGRFEMADRGTIFLDEIGDITPATQVKLLRVLQEKQFERVGGSETLRVDVRVVSATNRDLEKAMRDGTFREDLYYRLNVITIQLPPLRERPDDLPTLVDHFIQKYNQETGRINPQVRAIEAIRYDSMHIPIARSNGITAAVAAPSGGLIAGVSCLLRLDGWTHRQMVVEPAAAMQIELPGLRAARGAFAGRRSGPPPADGPALLKELRRLFGEARAYEKRRDAAAGNGLLALPEFNETCEAILPLLKGRMPAMIAVHGERDIRAAIAFVRDENIKAVFYGAEQGFKAAGEIAKAGIPVILGSLYDLPPVWEDGYDALYRNPGILAAAGVKIAFSSSSASLAKDLPYHAAKAAAFGLDRAEALRAVTINPAEILGVAATMGSLEKGKAANIVLADDDILEMRTNIRKVYIDGREVDLANRYTELLDKFRR